MAARNLSQPRTLAREVVMLFGGGTGAGTSALTSVVGAGIASITRTGVGLHTVTLSDKWNKLLHFSFEIMDPTTVDDWDVRVLAETVSTNKTITIAVFKAGTAADLSTDEKLKFMLVLLNSAQPPSAQ